MTPRLLEQPPKELSDDKKQQIRTAMYAGFILSVHWLPEDGALATDPERTVTCELLENNGNLDPGHYGIDPTREGDVLDILNTVSVRWIADDVPDEHDRELKGARTRHFCVQNPVPIRWFPVIPSPYTPYAERHVPRLRDDADIKTVEYMVNSLKGGKILCVDWNSRFGEPGYNRKPEARVYAAHVIENNGNVVPVKSYSDLLTQNEISVIACKADVKWITEDLFFDPFMTCSQRSRYYSVVKPIPVRWRPAPAAV